MKADRQTRPQHHAPLPRFAAYRKITTLKLPASRKFRVGLRLFTILCLAAVLLLALNYVVIVPRRTADQYLAQLKASNTLLAHTCFKRIAASTQTSVFNDPDTTPAKSSQLLIAAESLVASCQRQLSGFSEAASDLPQTSRVRYASSYHTAQVEQRRAANLVNQSNDVLTNYDQALTYLITYFGYAATFEQKTNEVNSVYILDSLTDKTPLLYNDADTLRNIASAFQNAPPADGYEKLQQAFVPVLRQAADGYDTLAYGLVINNDSLKNLGIQTIEQASNAYTSKVRILPAQLSQSAPAMQNVLELPDKAIDFTDQ